jgi:peptidase inhibitor family I36
MHTLSVERKVLLGALAALALFAGALFASTPKASASLSQCPENAVCVWQNNDFTGEFSWWPASNEGCHNHASNPQLRSGWNRTSLKVRWGGSGLPGVPGELWQLLSGNSITGEICWPV